MDGDGNGPERRQSDVKADGRPVTPFHVSIIPSICHESPHFLLSLRQIILNANSIINENYQTGDYIQTRARSIYHDCFLVSMTRIETWS